MQTMVAAASAITITEPVKTNTETMAKSDDSTMPHTMPSVSAASVTACTHTSLATIIRVGPVCTSGPVLHTYTLTRSVQNGVRNLYRETAECYGTDPRNTQRCAGSPTQICERCNQHCRCRAAVKPPPRSSGITDAGRRVCGHRRALAQQSDETLYCHLAAAGRTAGGKDCGGFGVRTLSTPSRHAVQSL